MSTVNVASGTSHAVFQIPQKEPVENVFDIAGVLEAVNPGRIEPEADIDHHSKTAAETRVENRERRHGKRSRESKVQVQNRNVVDKQVRILTGNQLEDVGRICKERNLQSLGDWQNLLTKLLDFGDARFACLSPIAGHPGWIIELRIEVVVRIRPDRCAGKTGSWLSEVITSTAITDHEVTEPDHDRIGVIRNAVDNINNIDDRLNEPRLDLSTAECFCEIQDRGIAAQIRDHGQRHLHEIDHRLQRLKDRFDFIKYGSWQSQR